MKPFRWTWKTLKRRFFHGSNYEATQLNSLDKFPIQTNIQYLRRYINIPLKAINKCFLWWMELTYLLLLNCAFTAQNCKLHRESGDGFMHTKFLVELWNVAHWSVHCLNDDKWWYKLIFSCAVTLALASSEGIQKDYNAQYIGDLNKTTWI